MKTLTAEQFLLDVANHKMACASDNGLYRHLRFRQPEPNSWNLHFEIITWPGSLTIHGDMGTWSFSRVEDMFTFFRSEELRINASYWWEKITGESRFAGPAKQFDHDIFKANVLSHLGDCEFEDTVKSTITEELEDEVFCEDESTARRALADYKCGEFSFSDSWEINGDGYSYHFLWCLFAIVWAIQKYDAAKQAKPEEECEEITL